jgi:hypothetical protein
VEKATNESWLAAYMHVHYEERPTKDDVEVLRLESDGEDGWERVEDQDNEDEWEVVEHQKTHGGRIAAGM